MAGNDIVLVGVRGAFTVKLGTGGCNASAIFVSFAGTSQTSVRSFASDRDTRPGIGVPNIAVAAFGFWQGLRFGLGFGQFFIWADALILNAGFRNALLWRINARVSLLTSILVVARNGDTGTFFAIEPGTWQAVNHHTRVLDARRRDAFDIEVFADTILGASIGSLAVDGNTTSVRVLLIIVTTVGSGTITIIGSRRLIDTSPGFFVQPHAIGTDARPGFATTKSTAIFSKLFLTDHVRGTRG